LSEEGYTTIFHPENKGVQGCKEKGDNLWTVSTNEEEGKEGANNAYNLRSTKQSIQV